MQVYSQKSIRTTFPRRRDIVRGEELILIPVGAGEFQQRLPVPKAEESRAMRKKKEALGLGIPAPVRAF